MRVAVRHDQQHRLVALCGHHPVEDLAGLAEFEPVAIGVRRSVQQVQHRPRSATLFVAGGSADIEASPTAAAAAVRVYVGDTARFRH